MAKKRRDDILETVYMLLAVGNTIDPQTQVARPLPDEYLIYYLCAHVYHCLPSELEAEDYETIMLHVEFYNLEQEFGLTKRLS